MVKMTVEELAREVLETLRLQREYFKRRDPGLLEQSKAAERRLAGTCKGILNPSLFGGDA